MLSFLVPLRDLDGWRTRLWEALRPRMEPLGEVLVSPDDGTDPFSRAQALNNAARAASGAYLVVCDSDTWVAPDAIRAAVAQRRAWAKPWRRKLKLGREATERILGGDFSWQEADAERINAYFAAAPLVVARDAWEAVGGFDERFRGWGGEDGAFGNSLRALFGHPGLVGGDAIHLWHPRIGRYGADAYLGQDARRESFNRMLERAYVRARQHPDRMRELIEGRA